MAPHAPSAVFSGSTCSTCSIGSFPGKMDCGSNADEPSTSVVKEERIGDEAAKCDMCMDAKDLVIFGNVGLLVRVFVLAVVGELH